MVTTLAVKPVNVLSAQQASCEAVPVGADGSSSGIIGATWARSSLA